ncbi:MAG TPA: LamG-like jellyroll fold domain-containing protein, partial [Actinomycetota bacterium]|nr:LamG-like jellyroll fold domain-containing protein [Actinomycetota bacterium]
MKKVGTVLALLVLTIGLPSVASSSYRDEVIADNPVSLWRLGENSGLTAADDRGVNPGTYANGVVLGTSGAIWNDADRAATFDGVDDQLSVNHSTTLDATTGVTVEVWLKRSKSGVFQPLVGKPLNGQSRFENYSLWLNTSSRPVAFFGNQTTFVSVTGTTVMDTNWHHLAATYDNATARLYVDGVLNASATSTVQLTPNVDRLFIGRTNSGGFSFGGALDEAAVYRAALSATRIRAHYDSARTDAIAPAVTLTQPPNGSISTNTVPTFSGSAGLLGGDSATVTVKVYPGSTPTGTPVQTRPTTRQSNGSYSVAASPALADGTYTAQAEQRDDANNLGLSSANTFSVDTTPPTVTIDSSPSDPSNSTSANFTFSANESLGGFQCRLDGGSFTTCVSPKSYSGL